MNGDQLHALASRLYPICRSITGNGVRRSLAIIREHIPVEVAEVPSGTAVFDWEVPLEWNIDDARIESPDGARIADFQAHNLHVVSYSEPVSTVLELADLGDRLHSIAEHPAWIPYRTSYYRRSWGFCLAHQTRQELRPGRYRVEIDSTLLPGSLSYGEFIVPGRRRDEILFFTHICHPSLANDNTSGLAVATALGAWLAGEPREFTYRVIFAPGTIGSLCWLKQNESSLGRVRAGLVLALLGDSSRLTYKASRDGGTVTDQVATYVVSQASPPGTAIPFSPYGYDERQLCSPGFNLPMGRLTRSVNGGYPEYHSSADDLSLIKPAFLEQSLDACKRFVTVLEQDARYVNLFPMGEPRLGKRGLYGSVGGHSPAQREEAILWVLNQSDGGKSLVDIALRSGLPFDVIREAAGDLEGAGLLRRSGEDTSGPAKNKSAGDRRHSTCRPAAR